MSRANSNTTYSEEELAREIAAGNISAFDQVYLQLYPALCLLALKISRSGTAAQDVVADVFLQLWEHRAALGKVADLKAYLYISTRNRTINYLKSKSLRVAEELTEEVLASVEGSSESFFEALLHTETVRALRKAVDSLPVECKRVTELVLKGHATNEIAEMLGITASAVSHQKARAVRLLKENGLWFMVLAVANFF